MTAELGEPAGASPGPVARYPVGLDLRGCPCLMAGGGVVGTRKVRGLLAVGAHVTVIAPELSTELHQAVADQEVSWVCRRFTPADLAPDRADRWRFVVAATDDPAVNAEVTALATAVGIWANDATAADGGPVALPAVYRDGAVTVTVSTGGAHPGAAIWLRDLLAQTIEPAHVAAIELMAQVRAESPGAERPDWRAAVDSGMLELIREGRVAEAKERLQACLSSLSD